MSFNKIGFFSSSSLLFSSFSKFVCADSQVNYETKSSHSQKNNLALWPPAVKKKLSNPIKSSEAAQKKSLHYTLLMANLDPIKSVTCVKML